MKEKMSEPVFEWEAILQRLHKVLEEHYSLYRRGVICEKIYLEAIRPIDKAIGEVEMAIFQNTSSLTKSSSEHIRKQEKCQSFHDTS